MLEYRAKSSDYFRSVRHELLDLIPATHRGGTLLELGAGGGDTLMYAKREGYASCVYGIELMRLDDSYQASEEIDAFHLGNIESDPPNWEEGKFDVILCGDVLEHLIDPERVVRALHRWLREGGILISSIPNIRSWETMVQIFWRGDFRYSERGVLDRTHLRFFCKRNIEELFHTQGFEILHNYSHYMLYPAKRYWVNRLSLGLFEEFLSVQYYTLSRKKALS